jgi:hypothetical protein
VDVRIGVEVAHGGGIGRVLVLDFAAHEKVRVRVVLLGGGPGGGELGDAFVTDEAAGIEESGSVFGDGVMPSGRLRFNGAGGGKESSIDARTAAVAENDGGVFAAQSFADDVVAEGGTDAPDVSGGEAGDALGGDEEQAAPSLASGEGESVDGVDAGGDAGEEGGDGAEESGFGSVGVDDVGADAAEAAPDAEEGEEVSEWADAALHGDGVSGDVEVAVDFAEEGSGGAEGFDAEVVVAEEGDLGAEERPEGEGRGGGED